ncbi:MAG: sulfotransferase [Balneolaceae bacterium]|nr:sulfotransferase [Balneolaceae bacterium]
MSISHEELNRKRSEAYRKSADQENFLYRFNESLVEFERQQYRQIEPEYPFLFVIGLPRSGTTLLSQLIAHCLDVGFINNLAARFWRAPVTGIRFARSVLDEEPFKAFQSHYGATEERADIHEFGYFWRHWLKKDSFENIKNAREIEPKIDWQGLRLALANMQRQFGRPMVFKNIFGSYHMSQLDNLLKQTLWIYIERDPLDTAISILRARQKYYDDPSTWWSYVPPEYEKIIDKDYRHQIAGQIHYLKQFFHRELDNLDPAGRGLTVHYQDLAQSPNRVLNTIRKRVQSLYGHDIRVSQPAPEQFEYRRYENSKQEKQKFKEILERFGE